MSNNVSLCLISDLRFFSAVLTLKHTLFRFPVTDTLMTHDAHMLYIFRHIQRVSMFMCFSAGRGHDATCEKRSGRAAADKHSAAGKHTHVPTNWPSTHWNTHWNAHCFTVSTVLPSMESLFLPPHCLSAPQRTFVPLGGGGFWPRLHDQTSLLDSMILDVWTEAFDMMTITAVFLYLELCLCSEHVELCVALLEFTWVSFCELLCKIIYLCDIYCTAA